MCMSKLIKTLHRTIEIGLHSILLHKNIINGIPLHIITIIIYRFVKIKQRRTIKKKSNE